MRRDIETTLLMHPHALADFLDYNDFLELADAAVAGEGLEGEIQVASFHPRYQFAGTRSEDIENYSNRSPYPMLHLLREASIARAVAMFPDAGQIFERNIETLRRLGHEGWRQPVGRLGIVHAAFVRAQCAGLRRMRRFASIGNCRYEKNRPGKEQGSEDKQ